MSDHQYTADDYLSALLSLLPRGRLWPRDADAVMVQAMRGLCPIYERSGGRALQLLRDAFPATAYELLPEWEAALGLPDACSALSGVSLEVPQRQAAVLAKFARSGGQSVPYFVALAASLGFIVTVTEFAPHSVEADVDMPLYGDAWAFAWQINAPSATVIEATVDSDVDMPLAIWGNALLECAMSTNKPAHSQVLFSYV